MDPDQTAPIGAVCSGSMLFASILNSSVMLGSYLQQPTFSDSFFSWHFKSYLHVFCVIGWPADDSNDLQQITVNVRKFQSLLPFCSHIKFWF